MNVEGMQSMNKYCIICDDSKYSVMYKALFSDVLSSDDVCFLDKTFKRGIDLTKKILYKNFVQKYAGLLCDSLFRNEFLLDDVLSAWQNEDDIENIYCLFLNDSLQKYYPRRKLEDIKRRYPKVELDLYFYDVVAAPQARTAFLLAKSGLFEKVFSFDKNDAKKYGFVFFPSPCSKFQGMKNQIVYDLYFGASIKGRAETISAVIENMGADILYEMDIFYNSSTTQDEIARLSKYIKVKSPRDILPYPELLKKEICSNCILEIVQEEQKGLTLRYYEAVCNNKKLLTNNPEVLSDKYYNPKYIQYFSKAEEIDWDWVKKRSNVDFQYKNDYSPIELLRALNEKSNPPSYAGEYGINRSV